MSKQGKRLDSVDGQDYSTPRQKWDAEMKRWSSGLACEGRVLTFR
ncbi:hypothetical protein BN1708_016472 [Verticillium longisporum]|uniref:Uncharacterized protein n=1 Tax=Verticillium longisporum TaxID=100787 RepID=A0A0G4MNH0_VERLO|nr:hypothetical protein BN1708_016472 [Verticillium longisporum]